MTENSGAGMRIAALDHSISEAMSAIAGGAPALDWLLLHAFQTDLLKLLPMIAVLLVVSRREGLRGNGIAGMVGAPLALAGAALAQRLGGDRVRPALGGLYDFPTLPAAVQADVVSFPSDTAAAAFALAAALGRCGAGPAWFGGIWSVAVVCLPRLYGGYHYASDLVAGAVIGAASCYLVLAGRSAARRITRVKPAASRDRAALQILSILYAFELGRLFADIRILVSG